ncbi:LOW QUALITY PROTEIN: 1-phosphatidylinositol 4,5-bisphosphate phosphodiesterase beta-1-like, partial [Leucoraja erinacea]|uniref:LOW QUALITY PROTEIN: 1-phosphatidylinositol 4,5-bisphosphate phosphodiesterase beta-1-like n=1 Tax=Leucoraja erinaceus TaxID=7782 RepID=UPI0024566018
ESIKPEDFTPEIFHFFLSKMCLRPDIDKIFSEQGAKGKPYLTLEQMTEFINLRQRDPRLNEVLYPPLKPPQVQRLIAKYEPNINFAQKGQISLDGFTRFLRGVENSIVPPESLDVSEDMNQPLSHYFINSSHNTYLTAGQLAGNSSVEMYRQVLLTGCRCVELDCWKGRLPDDEPFITHGFTMTTEIPFKEVIEAIAESAFKASPYPLILSFENHVDSAKQQARWRSIVAPSLGRALLVDPLDKYPYWGLVPGPSLPSPQELRGRILIKNKKRRDLKASIRQRPGAPPSLGTGEGAAAGAMREGGEGTHTMANGDEQLPRDLEEIVKLPRKSIDREAESDFEEEEDPEMKKQPSATDEGTAGSEVNATEEMSTLVNYVEPVKFKSFQVAAQRNRYYEMSSLVETKGLEQLTKSPVEFVEYNKKQLSRIYPKGTRVDSSNYMPQVFWSTGCPMVALNFQTLDLPMQLNMGIFEYNGGIGYILKPEFMRRVDKHFDPFTENIVDGIVANTVAIRIISGQYLTDKHVGVYVDVDMFGLPIDTKRKFRTKIITNSLNLVWDEEPFVFHKVVLPTLASLRVAVYEEGGKFIGHRVLPVSAIRPGEFYICLRNEANQPLQLPALLVYTEVKDFVPDIHKDYIKALYNPIQHVNLMEQRSKQLVSLTGEEEMLQVCRSEPCLPVEEARIKPDVRPLTHLHRCSLTPSISDRVPSIDTGNCRSQEDLIPTILSAGQGVNALTLGELRQSRGYEKLRHKQQKELQQLQHKHLKSLASLRKEHCSKVQELEAAALRRGSPLARALRHKPRYRNATTRGALNNQTFPVSARNVAYFLRSIDAAAPAEFLQHFYETISLGAPSAPMPQLQGMDAEATRKLRDLRRCQWAQLLQLRRDLQHVEMYRRMQQFSLLHGKLREIALENQATQMKKLQQLCDREQKELKKDLDRQRLEHITQVKAKDKQAAQRKREEQLQQQHRDVLQQIDEEGPKEQKLLTDAYKLEMEQLPLDPTPLPPEVRGHRRASEVSLEPDPPSRAGGRGQQNPSSPNQRPGSSAKPNRT